MSQEPLLHARWAERVRRDTAGPPTVRVRAPAGRPVRVAIISDPHGQIHALRAVVDDLAVVQPDAVVVGGDIAQGAPAPGPVVDLIRDRGWPAVIGNADAFLLDIDDGAVPSNVSASLLESGRWSLDQMSDVHLNFLRTLPGALRVESPGHPAITIVHATPWSLEDIVLRDAPEDVAARMLDAARTPILAYGHIHSPYRRRVSEGLLLSVGAVSVSNDRDPRPAYTVLTLDQIVAVEVRRVAYDVEAAVTAMRASGAPLGETMLRAMVAGGPWEVAPLDHPTGL